VLWARYNKCCVADWGELHAVSLFKTPHPWLRILNIVTLSTRRGVIPTPLVPMVTSFQRNTQPTLWCKIFAVYPFIPSKLSTTLEESRAVSKVQQVLRSRLGWITRRFTVQNTTPMATSLKYCHAVDPERCHSNPSSSYGDFLEMDWNKQPTFCLLIIWLDSAWKYLQLPNKVEFSCCSWVMKKQSHLLKQSSSKSRRGKNDNFVQQQQPMCV